MKRSILLAIIFLGTTMVSTAQTDWYGEKAAQEQQRSLSEGGLTGGSTPPADPAIPVGEGVLILAALGGAYGIWRKRRD